MEPLTLLIEAERAGLRVRVDGNRLVVRGPRTAEALAQEILACKPALIPLLAWDEDRASALLSDELGSLTRMAPTAWRATEAENEAIHAGQDAIDTAFVMQDMVALHRALREYRWAVFRSWRRYNAAGTPITLEMMPMIVTRLTDGKSVIEVRPVGAQPCRMCSRTVLWRTGLGRWSCRHCLPPTSTAVTDWCVEMKGRWVAIPARIRGTLVRAGRIPKAHE